MNRNVLLTRELTGHQVNECNEAIQILADERDPLNGNASHVYKMNVGEGPREVPHSYYVLEFQHGPIKEVGTNGITNEALLAILIDRTEGFQSGPYKCDENELALVHLTKAKEAFFERTRKRVARGVEGTHQL